MRLKYLSGFIASNLYRFFRVFPNSDPLMGFIVPCSKNEAVWKAPLFAFASMFIFDFFTSGIGTWTIVTSFTYAFAALLIRGLVKGKKSSIRGFISAGGTGVLMFDFITGPVMSTFLFQQEFIATLAMQVPFTIMHFVSVVFSIIIIAPFLDKEIAKEMQGFISAVKETLGRAVLQI